MQDDESYKEGWEKGFHESQVQTFGKVIEKTVEMAAQLIERNKILSGSIGPLFDAGWMSANETAGKLIREKITPEKVLEELQ